MTSPGAGTRPGTVEFKDAGVTISGCSARTLSLGQATCSVAYSSVASHSITAVYSGDTNFSTSTSSPLSQTMNKASTSTGVVSSVNPSVTGQTVTYTANVAASGFGSGTPTGTVTLGGAPWIT